MDAGSMVPGTESGSGGNAEACLLTVATDSDACSVLADTAEERR